MNTNLAFSSPEDNIKKIQSIDRNILKDAVVITNVQEVIELMKFFEAQKTTANPNKERIDQNISTLYSILEQRIRITAKVLNITESTGIILPSESEVKQIVEEHVTLSNQTDGDLVNQPIEERQAASEGKTIDATDKFVKAANKSVNTHPIENEEKGIIGEFEDDKQKTVCTSNLTEHTIKEQTEELTVAEIVENTSVEGLTLETLKNECLLMLEASGKVTVMEHFKKEIQNVTNLTDKEKKAWGKYWNETTVTFNKALEEKRLEKTAEPTKEEIVAKAEEAAIEGKEELTESTIKETVTNIIRTSYVDKTINAMNKVREYFSIPNVRKFMSTKFGANFKPHEYFKKIKEEVKIENTSTTSVDNNVKIVEPKLLDIQTSNPEIWKEAIECDTFPKFESLIKSLVFERNNWDIARNLSLQYIGNYEGAKDWTNERKLEWFKEFVKNNTKKVEETQSEEQSSTSEQTTSTEEVKYDSSLITKETNSKRIKAEAVKALAAGLSEEEVIKLIKQTKPYKGTRPEEMINVMKSIKKFQSETSK